MWIVAVLLICCAFFVGTIAGVHIERDVMAEFTASIVAEFMANLSKQFKEIAESEMKKSK